MTNPVPQSEPAIAVVVCEVEIDRPIESAWRAIGHFANAGQFLNVSSKLVAGDGAIGSIRLIGDSVLEVLVAIGPYCYGYTQIQGPMASLTYHGCLSLQQAGPGLCKLTYTILYDQSVMEGPRRVIEARRIDERFKGAVQAMKRATEIARLEGL